MTSNAKRDAAFDKELKEANRCCESCYNFTLKSRITFERGWGARDAEVAELSAQLDEQLPTLSPEEIHKTLLNHGLCVTKEEALKIIAERDSLRQQVEEHNRKEVIFQKELTYLRSVIEECVSEMKKEIKTRDDAIEVAVKALKSVSSFNKNDGNAPSDNMGPDSMSYWRWQELISRDISRNAIEQINTLLGREGS